MPRCKPPSQKGKKRTEETRKKLSESHKGRRLSIKTEFKKGTPIEEHPRWKGENAGYHSKHSVISRLKGLPRKCEHCGTETAKMYHWSNKDHKYSRNPDDYQRLCCSCHYKYDVANGLRSKSYFKKQL